MGNRNPSNNSILQALLDATDCGLGTLTIDQAITKLSSSSKLRTTLQAKWNAHAYPEKSMDWTQLVKAQQLMTLSDTALKLLAFMGMYAHQSTLLQVSYKDLVTFTGIKDRMLRTAVKELKDSGCIRVEKPSVRHAAPIYAVNPALISKGTRRKGKTLDFVERLDGCQDYILRRSLPLLVQQETVYQDTPDGGRIAFNRLRPVPAEEAKPAGKARGKRQPKGGQLPGQMSLDDFPEVTNGKKYPN